jgi:hypothetical protein
MYKTLYQERNGQNYVIVNRSVEIEEDQKENW